MYLQVDPGEIATRSKTFLKRPRSTKVPIGILGKHTLKLTYVWIMHNMWKGLANGEKALLYIIYVS